MIKENLLNKYPYIAAEWHPTKNGDLKPDMVAPQSNKKVWWFLNYADPSTGQRFDFEWRATISSRTVGGHGCPYLAVGGHDVWPGFNDLLSRYPDIASEWHPTKNGDLTPDKVRFTSRKYVWWLLLYHDPETDTQFSFEWQASICDRTNKGYGCPYLAPSNTKVWPGFNDLQTKRPDIAREWHPLKNGDLTPDMVTVGSNRKVWWYLPYDDPNTRQHFNFEWEATINSRTLMNTGCPFLSNGGAQVWPGFNDLATRYPDIATQWHPTKNGELTPDRVTYGSKYNAWWLYPYDDPDTGEHFNFVWQVKVLNRTLGGNGCPYLSATNPRAWPGFNDLATKYPEIAAQWHPTKNGSLTPQDVTVGSKLKVWWFYPYDDPITGKHINFEWKVGISNRTLGGNGCPYLSVTNPMAWEGFNDLQTKAPELAKQWHPQKNGNLLPVNVTPRSQKPVWWMLPYDDPETGEHFNFEWKISPHSRRVDGSDCPYLANQAVWRGFNDLATRKPLLAAQWHPTKNGKLTPKDVVYGCTTPVWWMLPYDDPMKEKRFNFEWCVAPGVRNEDGSDCPFLSNKAVWSGFNDLESCCPHIALEWHPSKNRKKRPNEIYKASSRKVWWVCSACGCEWYASVKGRTVDGSGCPQCRREQRRLIMAGL